MMNFTKFAALACLALTGLSGAVLAEDLDAAGVTVGATVYGPQGNEVGKVEQILPGAVVLNTGTHSATLAAASLGKGAKGPSITMTRDQLNGAIEAAEAKAQAALDAALVPGAAVRSSDGVALGAIKGISDEGLVEITRDAGAFSLKKDMFATDANGVIARITAQQIEEALAKTAQ